jgi:hypothetical protein
VSADADRIAQLEAELAEARSKWSAEGLAHEIAKRERDAALAREQAAQAEAAAMRLAVEPAFEEYVCRGEEPESLDEAHRVFMNADAGRALAARVPLLEQKARFNDIRQRAALALFDRGFIEAPHEDGCPQDDTCDCPLMPLAQAVVNDDARLQKVDAAAAEKALAALDENAKKEGAK